MEAQRTIDFLQSKSVRLTIRNVDVASSQLQLDVLVENLTGHKFPTAYPSRRAWLHVVVRDRNGRTAFESGALRPDGSIEGNDNDADPARFEPHYREIKTADQVQIYEPILKDQSGHVTTGSSQRCGLFEGQSPVTGRLSKQNAEKILPSLEMLRTIRLYGCRGPDPLFRRAKIIAPGPFHVDVELWYQPIGFRWAHNLSPYKAMEPQRFVEYYEASPADTAIILAHSTATR